MRTHRTTSPAVHRLLAVGAMLAAAACSGLLDVKNPNNVNQSDLANPASATAQVNGVLSSVARAWGQILTPYAIATDELTWIGSRDAWRNLDEGQISEPTNEFVDAAFFFVGEARWWADETINRLQGFATRNVLPDSSDLGRAYFCGAIVYTMIGNLFDNFPIGSDRRTAAAPLGAASMDSVYKAAINYATSGIAIAQARGNKALELDLTAARAVARYYLALWGKLNPPPAGVPLASPLVNDAGAVADANRALALAVGLNPSQPDYRFRFSYSSSTISTDIGFEVNERKEMRIGGAYVDPPCTESGCGSGGKTDSIARVSITDPITGKSDPEITRFLLNSTEGFTKTTRFGPLTFLSARELHLIVAEAALAGGDVPGFTAEINNLRLLNFPDSVQYKYNPSNPAHPTPLAMLQYARQVNLFLQGRRLADHYRFGVPADIWQAGEEALTTPGTFLPITISERLANAACIANPTSCGGH